MSALGQKQTLGKTRLMSALPPKADIGTQSWNVRFVPKADIGLKETLSCAVRTARELSLQGSRFHKAGAAA
jgi:hypothetical protein